MKKFSGIVAVLALCYGYFILTQPIFAHTAETSGEITASLHVDPGDSPVAGEQASLIFLFDDETNRFRTTNCDCTVTISFTGSGEKLFTTILPRTGIVQFTFPEKSVYTVKIEGEPKKGFVFQSFTSSYEIRVDRVAGTDNTKSLWMDIQSMIKEVAGEEVAHFLMMHLFHILIFGGSMLVCIYIIFNDSD